MIKRRISLIISAASATASAWSFGALGEDFAEEGVVLVFVYVVDADVSSGGGMSVRFVCLVCHR